MTNIELLRRQKGLSVKELAALIGVTPGAVSQWESGEKKPRRERLGAIAEALGTTVEAIKGEQKSAIGLPDDAEEELVKVFTLFSREDAEFLRRYANLPEKEKASVRGYVSGLEFHTK